jgi:hypothetical protein
LAKGTVRNRKPQAAQTLPQLLMADTDGAIAKRY